MKKAKVELLVFRNFHIEFPSKKKVNHFNKYIADYMAANFPEQCKSEYDTLEALIYATSLKEVICKKVAELSGFKVELSASV